MNAAPVSPAVQRHIEALALSEPAPFDPPEAGLVESSGDDSPKAQRLGVDLPGVHVMIGDERRPREPHRHVGRAGSLF